MTRISFTSETENKIWQMNFVPTEVLAELEIIVDTFFQYDTALVQFEFKNIFFGFKTSAIVTMPTNKKNFKLTRALLLLPCESVTA